MERDIRNDLAFIKGMLCMLFVCAVEPHWLVALGVCLCGCVFFCDPWLRPWLESKEKRKII